MATDATVTVYVHARRFWFFLWVVETLTVCGVLSEARAFGLVERWGMAILAPYIKTAYGRVRL
jgi:hypothetical protein